MHGKGYPRKSFAFGGALVIALGLGMVLGPFVSSGIAQMDPPTEHKGLTVKKLGVVDAASVEAQLGLEGHILLLREITIAPGGQIAKHSHAAVPGLVKVIDGEWIEGTAMGEEGFEEGDTKVIAETAETTHWFYNRGAEPATAYVCDVRPAG